MDAGGATGVAGAVARGVAEAVTLGVATADGEVPVAVGNGAVALWVALTLGDGEPLAAGLGEAAG